MGPGSSLLAVPDRPPLTGPRPETGPTVVWLRGEQDISTDGALCLALARAMALNDTAIVVDLSEVELMCASTLGVIVAARELLRQRSRLLTVRSPSTYVRRVIGICRLDALLAPSPEELDALAAKALGSWVTVPATEQAGRQTDMPAPGCAAELVGQGAALMAQAATAERVANIA